jgi:glycosyltransferase involved in cell wall biosynthesis
MEKIRVLHLIHDLKKGGGERFALDVVNSLTSFPEVEVKLGVLQPNNQYPNLTENLPIEWLNSIYQPSIAGKTVLINEDYRKIVNEFNPHIIHTHLIRAELMSSTFIKNDIVYVTHCHDNMEEFENFSFSTFHTKRKFTNFFEKVVLKKNKYKFVQNYFITNSNHTQKYFKSTVPKKYQDNVVMIQYGFDFNRFNMIVPNCSSEKLTLTMIGSFMHKKNQKFLVEVAKILKQYTINFEMYFLGDGEYREANEKLAIAYGLENHVHFEGIVHNIEDYLAKTNIYVHSAYYEPFGLVFLEAMASGIPVVCLDGKGNRDIIKNHFNGFMLMEENPKLFADKILHLWQNKNEYSNISQNCVKFAEKFDLSFKTAELVNFYKNILNMNN